MSKAIVIDKPIQPFDDHMDFSRNNPDRKLWGKHDSANAFHLGDEYAEPAAPEAQEPKPVTPEPPAPPQKFTHKLSNGTVLEADSLDALAALIEKSFQTPAPPADAPLEFEDAFPYKPVDYKRKELSLQEQADILNVWKENPQKAFQMLMAAECGQPDFTASLTRSEQRELERATLEAGMRFMEDVEEYNPTKANGKLLSEYLTQQKKPVTTHNLKVAYQRLLPTHPELKSVPAPVAEPEPDEPEPQPPAVIPAGSGLAPDEAQPKVDVNKFKSMSLEDQKKFFSALRRGA